MTSLSLSTSVYNSPKTTVENFSKTTIENSPQSTVDAGEVHRRLSNIDERFSRIEKMIPERMKRYSKDARSTTFKQERTADYFVKGVNDWDVNRFETNYQSAGINVQMWSNGLSHPKRTENEPYFCLYK